MRKILFLVVWALAAVVAIAAETRGGTEWRKLFADADWYNRQKGEEQVFAGTLEKVPEAKGKTTLMRTSYYKLGARNLYTGAAKVPALDALVGKKVEIRGKAVDIDGLEGHNVREIWPAAICPAAP